MGARRYSPEYAFKFDTELLVTDSVVLREKDVTAAVEREKSLRGEGDILRGLKYGLIFSAVLWGTLIFGGFLIFR